MRVSVTECKAKIDYYLAMVEVEKKEIVLTRNDEAIAMISTICSDE